MGGNEGPGGRGFRINECRFNPRALLPLAALAADLAMHRAIPTNPSYRVKKTPYFSILLCILLALFAEWAIISIFHLKEREKLAHKSWFFLAAFLLIENIRKTFAVENALALTVLDGINLDFENGEFIALIGPSGCGKSTLLRLIAGIIKSDEGKIVLDNEAIDKPGYERGLVFQDPTLFPWKSIYENIAFELRSRGVYHKEKHRIPDFFQLRTKILELLHFAGKRQEMR